MLIQLDPFNITLKIIIVLSNYYCATIKSFDQMLFSTTKNTYHLATNVQNSGEYFSESNLGGSLVTIDFIRPKKPTALIKGCTPVAISIIEIPSDQMSAFIE